MKNKDLKVLGILSILFIILIFIYMGFNNVYGSMTDYVMQHSVIPDYFRTLFYETGNLFPNFAPHLGAGENIYYFSYYGLLNPLILISYLLPFIEMIDYLIIVNILVVIISSFMIYKWLCQNKVEHREAFISTILFMLINAFFHTHRHVMFIDYMPFLILGLMGIDRYFNKKGSALYIISVFLMIMTSYYYSIGGLICLVIYGIYKYISINKKISVKKFLLDGFQFIIPILIGILMSCILLIPTAFTLVSNRAETSELIPLREILIPNFSFEALLYSNYGMGFTAIAIIALIYLMFNSKKETKFISTIIFIVLSIPIFMYLLNGTLYLRAKVFIPFSPLIILLISTFLSEFKNKGIKIPNLLIASSVILLLSIIFDYHDIYFLLDLLITTIGFVFCTSDKGKYIYALLIFIALCSNIVVNRNDEYITRDTYNTLKADDLNQLLGSIEDDTFYRSDNLLSETSLTVNKIYNANYYQTSVYSSTYNSDYKNFYDNTINNSIPYRNNFLRATTNNIMFETLMGIKYIVTSEDNVPIGYSKIAGDEVKGLYRNDDVLPLGYSTSKLISNKDFDSLMHPFRSEAILGNIIVDKDVKSNYISNINEKEIQYHIEEDGINKTADGYNINLSDQKDITLNLEQKISDKILFISFTIDEPMSCKDGDIKITINGIKNTLTCKEWLYFNNNYTFDYVISSYKDIDKLDISLSRGLYDIIKIKVYTLDYNNVKEAVNSFDKFIVDKKKTMGDIIEGKINVTADGYFATTIPYDKGFSIYMDGKKVSYENVNAGFIGFPIDKGNHNIKMVYRAKGFNAGLCLTIIGLILFTGNIIVDKKRRKEL